MLKYVFLVFLEFLIYFFMISTAQFMQITSIFFVAGSLINFEYMGFISFLHFTQIPFWSSIACLLSEGFIVISFVPLFFIMSKYPFAMLELFIF